jgi:hypothetical protein
VFVSTAARSDDISLPHFSPVRASSAVIATQ